MHRPELVAPALQSVGMIHCIDTVNRELTVIVAGELLTFDVPVGCEVFLHGERVRLRLLQPGDWARLKYTRRGRLLAAHAIEIPPHETSPTRGPRSN